MTPHNSAARHLSEDDLDEVLLGIATPVSTAHLAGCELCADRFTAFQTELRSQMDAFNQASMAWSEARSNTISRDVAHHKATSRLTLPKLWSAAAAMVLAATIGLHVTLDRRAVAPEASNSSTIQTASASLDAIHPEHDQAEIATDNAMLAAIDSEIGTPKPTQFGLYQKIQAAVPPAQPMTPEQLRD